MEIASLIILIVSLILLAGITFLIFQIWLSTKEIKLTFPKMFEEVKNHYSAVKETILDLKATHNDNLSNLGNSLTTKINEHFDNLKKTINSLENKSAEDQIRLNKHIEDSLEKVKDSILKISNTNKADVIEKIGKIEQNLNNEVQKLHKAITEPLDL